MVETRVHFGGDGSLQFVALENATRRAMGERQLRLFISLRRSFGHQQGHGHLDGQ